MAVGTFGDGWALRVARNTSSCDGSFSFVGGLAASNLPVTTISNVVRWSVDDSSTLWTASFTPKFVVESGMICWSNNSGINWQVGYTARNDSLFRIWKSPPAAVISPQTVTAGQLARVVVMQALPRFSRGVLVSNESSCFGLTPQGPLTSVSRLAGNGFEFHPQKRADQAFLCVSLSFRGPWSVVPFVTDGASRNITIYDSSVRFKKATVICTARIAGVRAYCTVEVKNRTLLPISPSTIQLLSLRDGGGVSECPLPALDTISATKVGFSFTPQRSGRDGTLSLLFQGLPLLIEPDNETIAFYTKVSNVKVQNLSSVYDVGVIPWYSQDLAVKKFVVQPPFSFLQQYAPTNLASYSSFNSTTDWVSQLGIARFIGRQNLSSSGELIAFSLNATNQQLIKQVIAIPLSSERCRFRIYYYLLAQGGQPEAETFIGSVTLSTTTGVIETFTLLAYQRQVIVARSDGRRVFGDIFSMEQIAAEFAVTSSPVTLAVTINHKEVRQLFFAGPEVLCTSSDSAMTNPQDVRALRRFFDAVGSGSTLQRWKVNGQYNGDPCTNQWQGVECRHMRVVALRLRNASLSGVLPHVRELTMLEVVDLSHNQIAGGLPFNNTRLKEVDVSFNKITSLSMGSGSFGFTRHLCLRRLDAQGNRVVAFPVLAWLPKLRRLDLASNELRSELPSFSQVSPQLEVLHLSTNHLFGTLPELPQTIVSLDLSANRFYSSIPTSWQFSRIKFLDISKNLVNGSIPWVISEIPSGRVVFRAEDNFLVGVVPRLSFSLVDVRRNFFQCPLMRPEIDTNTSEMNVFVNWGVSNWCDFNSASAGF